MQFSLTACLLGLAAVVSALPGDFTLAARQNDGRPVPTGTCCVANTSLKEDSCTSSSGQSGRCVPGGNDCEPPHILLGLMSRSGTDGLF